MATASADAARARAGDRDLAGAHLAGADLSRLNLRRADLRQADLRGASLRETDLRGANLRGAKLRGADLKDAKLNGAKFDPSDLAGAIGLPRQSAGSPLFLEATTGGATLDPDIASRKATPVASRPTSRTVVGLFLNPVSFELAQGVYEYVTIVYDVASKESIARGSIEASPRSTYAVSAWLSGYPRVHASPGVAPAYRGRKAWGTPLYACAAAAAKLAHDGVINLQPGTVGDKAGVSSKSEYPGGRSPDADKWWDRALLERVATRRAMKNGEETLEIDVLTFQSVDEAGWVVAMPTGAEPDGLRDHSPLIRMDDVRKSVLRIVNTAYLSTLPSGHEAMKRLVEMATRSGLARRDIESMIDRYNDGLDSGAVRFEESPMTARQNPRRSRKIAPMQPLVYGPRRNPVTVSSSMEKKLRELHEARAAMGYARFEDMP